MITPGDIADLIEEKVIPRVAEFHEIDTCAADTRYMRDALELAISATMAIFYKDFLQPEGRKFARDPSIEILETEIFHHGPGITIAGLRHQDEKRRQLLRRVVSDLRDSKTMRVMYERSGPFAEEWLPVREREVRTAAANQAAANQQGDADGILEAMRRGQHLRTAFARYRQSYPSRLGCC